MTFIFSSHQILSRNNNLGTSARRCGPAHTSTNITHVAKKLRQLTHFNARFPAIFYACLVVSSFTARSWANPHIVRVAVSDTSQVAVNINSVSARTVPRPRCREYCGTSRIDVAAALDPVVRVDGRMLILGEIITHVQGRRLMDNARHQELRDIRLRCFPATCPVAVIMPVLKAGFLLARHRVNGFQSNHARIVIILPVEW